MGLVGVEVVAVEQLAGVGGDERLVPLAAVVEVELHPPGETPGVADGKYHQPQADLTAEGVLQNRGVRLARPRPDHHRRLRRRQVEGADRRGERRHLVEGLLGVELEVWHHVAGMHQHQPALPVVVEAQSALIDRNAFEGLHQDQMPGTGPGGGVALLDDQPFHCFYLIKKAFN